MDWMVTGTVTSEDTIQALRLASLVVRLSPGSKVVYTFNGYPAGLASAARKGYASEGGY